MIKNILWATIFALISYNVYQIFYAPARRTLIPDELHQSYNYIVIGAGSAGSVVASRLSEDPTKTVLLLEAGGDENVPFYTHIPGSVQYLARSVMDWGFFTEPQTECCNAMQNRQVYWPRGKCLGGTSVMNWMVYVRGHPADFDRWEELGNPGWSYKDVLPYFMRSETTEVEHLKQSPIHGNSGPLHITEASKTAVGEAFMEATKEMGLKETSDSSGLETDGFGRVQFFTHKGVRQSVAKYYLRPAMSRKNLHVITNAYVTKILLSKEKGQPIANGVQFSYGEKLYDVKAKREVILSAGTVKSPQVLMLSGVGPAEQLKHHNIPVVVDSPSVGKNLDDHLIIALLYSINVTSATTFEHKYAFKNLLKSIPQLLFQGSGAFSTTPMELVGFFNTGITTKHKGPDVELYVFHGRDGGPDPVRFGNLKQEILDIFDLSPQERSYYTFAVSLLHPHNVGEIRLRTDKPFDAPVIDPMYFQNDKDDKVVGAGLKMLINFMQTKAMKKYDPQLMEKPMPGCDHLKFLSDEYLACVAKHRTTTVFHPIGTCRMGRDILTSVVDANLKVHGVRGLRVVDASVFPDHTSGNINAPTIMVAEKAVDLIKMDQL